MSSRKTATAADEEVVYKDVAAELAMPVVYAFSEKINDETAATGNDEDAPPALPDAGSTYAWQADGCPGCRQYDRISSRDFDCLHSHLGPSCVQNHFGCASKPNPK